MMLCKPECECVYCQMDTVVEEAKKNISSGEDVIVEEVADVEN